MIYPIVFEDIPIGSPAYKEEFFGPVFNLFKVRDDSEAIHLANDSEYGLGGSIYSQNEE